MRRFSFLVLAVFLAACGSGNGTPTAAEQPTQTSAPVEVPSTPTPVPNSAAITPAVSTGSPQALSLDILTPEDNAVVTSPQLEVRGVTAPNAVVTVNETIALADDTGAFDASLALDEGPNVVEVVASDDQGNESYVELVVTYAP